MHATERPLADQPSTMTQDEALRLLANTRRTLLKLVANIDAATGAIERESGQEGRERASAAR